jgi:hypothetical protein
MSLHQSVGFQSRKNDARRARVFHARQSAKRRARVVIASADRFVDDDGKEEPHSVLLRFEKKRAPVS